MLKNQSKQTDIKWHLKLTIRTEKLIKKQNMGFKQNQKPSRNESQNKQKQNNTNYLDNFTKQEEFTYEKMETIPTKTRAKKREIQSGIHRSREIYLERG